MAAEETRRASLRANEFALRAFYQRMGFQAETIDKAIDAVSVEYSSSSESPADKPGRDATRLYCLSFETDCGVEVFIAEDMSVTQAMLQAGSAGQRGQFLLAHELGDETAKRIPRDIIGRSMPREQAERVLKGPPAGL
jgi:hypothetical protein